ncbi:putative DNA-binding transcriptional regulator YafY [Paenibacillus sacheonensis]|nr:putative DNA-binding transcriptional regulator YafY [Paenibacillus sacheonensis]
MTKSDNMLSILWMLRSGKRMTAKQLAEELEIHVRAVYRCIDSLCASEVPILADSGPNGGYSILSRFTDSPLFFDIEEQKALIHASIFAKEAGHALVERKPEEAVFQLEHSMLQTYVPYFLMAYSTALQIESELLVGKMVEANARMLAHYEAMLANSTRRKEDER